MPRADRIFALTQLLSGPRRRTIDEIAQELEVSPRTLFRDLADLEERGIPIERVDGTYRILDSAHLRPLNFTPRERLLLGAVLSTPAVVRHPAYKSDLTSVRLKVAAGGADAPAMIRDRDRSGPLKRELVEEIERAIAEHRTISICYTSLTSGRAEWRNVDPLAIVHRAEAWYLVGRCHRNDEVRIFRMDRVSGVLSIGSHFAPPDGFDVDAWLEPTWGIMTGAEVEECVIEFGASIAPLIEHASHHPTEQKTKRGDGSIDYRVRVANVDELARWIVGFGGAARAIAPIELVDSVQRIAAGALAAHPHQRKAAYTARKRR